MTISRHNFNEIASKPAKKREAPFSLRLSFEEKAALKEMAGDVPLGAYIKAVLFDEARSSVQRSKGAVRDDQAVGRALGQLGKSRLSQNLNQLAKSANMGALPVTPETESELKEACRAIQEMRDALMAALSDGGSP